MAKLSNSPKQALNFDLERRKSFTFRVRLKYSDGSLVNLTGCTLRFVMKEQGTDDDHFDLNNLVVNSEATIGAPLTGEGVFAFQAAELDGDPGEYGYSIVLWSPDNFSTVLAKGFINLLDNSESHSMHRLYSATAPTSALELTLRGGDVVEVEVVSLPQVPVPIDAISWPDVGDKPESFPPSTHGHTINEVAGLATELAGKQPAGNYAASVHQHTVSDVNGLQGALDGKSPTSHNHDGTYAPATHGHTIANVTGLQTALDGKAASSHSHTIANVTGLQSALDGKQPAGSYAASSHTHTSANISDFTEATQDVVGGMVAAAGGTYNDAAGTITLPSGGGGGAVDSVAGRTGAVVLSSADLTDAASLATDAELTSGLAGKANTTHAHTIANVTGLQTALDGKQPAGSYAASAHTHAPEDITGTAVVTTDPRLSDARTPTAHTHPASQISDSTETGRSVLTATDAAEARTAIGAGTSNLAIGTSSTTAAAGNRQATATVIGMVELATTAEATAGTDTVRAVTPAGLKAVADTKAASTHTHAPEDITGTAVVTTDPRLSDARTPTAHTHPASQISDSTETGRSVLTATDAAEARTAIGAGTSNLAIGTSSTTAAAGNRQATATVIGMVELATTAEATAGTDTVRAVTPAGLKAVADTKAASTHTHTSADVADFTEATQDVVGGMVAAAGGTYNDAAGTITLPSGGGGGSTGTVQFVVARTSGASVNVAASGYTTYPLDGTPTVNIGGGSWNAGTYVYTVPSNGLYLCLGMIRIADSSAERSTALGIGTINEDGPHVDWSVMGGSGARMRNSRQYTRLARFTAGDQVRMYIYSDGATFPTHASSGSSSGQYMSIIKIAD